MFSKSELAKLDIQLRSIPIVMPKDRHETYPARSKLRKKQKLYDCAPQLDYEVFLKGDFESQVEEYLAGIVSSAPYLASLGASKEQVAEFRTILAGAAKKILLLKLR